MTILFNGARLKVFGTDGKPLAGGWVYTYSAGTTTPKTAWSDYAKSTPLSNPFQLDAYGEATVFMDGAYKVLIKDASFSTLPGYPVDNVTADYVSSAALSASSGATLIGYGSSTVAAALAAAGTRVAKRQCVLAGPHNTDGTPNLGGSTGSTSVTTSNISSGASMLVVTAGGGYSSSGGIDYVGFSNSNLTFSALSTNGVMYGYVDINTTTGALTTGTTTLAPQYGYGTPPVTNGQFYYCITEGIGYVGNGSSATQVNRVFVGEFTVAANVVSAIRWYAYRGYYESAVTAITISNTYTFQHNIGASLCEISVFFRESSSYEFQKHSGAITTDGGTIRGLEYGCTSATAAKIQTGTALTAPAFATFAHTNACGAAEVIVRINRAW